MIQPKKTSETKYSERFGFSMKKYKKLDPSGKKLLDLPNPTTRDAALRYDNFLIYIVVELALAIHY